MTDPVSVLFVCTGNICRSPMAEAVLRHLAEARGVDVRVDGAGTEAYHVGESPHRLALQTLAKHHVAAPGAAREVRPSDFEEFDHIVAMDRGHKRQLLAWRGSVEEKISLLHDWSPEQVPVDVPDPYYGGAEDYEEVFGYVWSGSQAILDRVAPP